MKIKLLPLVCLICFTILCSTACKYEVKANDNNINTQIKKVDSIPNFFVHEGFYLSGQPTEKTLQALKKQGLKTLINLRSKSENERHNKTRFNEQKKAEALGIKYVSIPIGNKNDYTPETVAKVAKIIHENKGKFLIHCASCGRVTYLWMAYLVNHKGYTPDQAIVVGKQMKYRYTFEEFLGKKIRVSVVD